jgi:hypothetical protein
VKNREGITALRSWMPYLHGDIIDKEFAAACFYEYERQRQWHERKQAIREQYQRTGSLLALKALRIHISAVRQRLYL